MNINKISNAITKNQNFCAKTRNREDETPSTPHCKAARKQNSSQTLKIGDYAYEAALMINLIVDNAKKRNIPLEDEYLRVKAAMPLVKKATRNDNYMLNYYA